jgi:hypothetical protein
VAGLIRKGALLCALATAIAIAASTATSGTTSPALLSGVAPGVEVEPLISVGDTIDGYTFESIPDGIAVHRKGKRAHVYVNHELSLVPFPAGVTDWSNALLSRLVFDPRSRSIVSGKTVIPSEANFQRFCSSFIADEEHGFERPFLFTNEEATDRVNRTGAAYPPGPDAEQAGVVVAYDIQSDVYKTLYSMGRYNHENSVAIPGYDRPVVLSGDDTFSAPASELYLYTAADSDAFMNEQGTLYGFASSDPSVNDYGDLTVGQSVGGRFVPVPAAVARGDQNALESWSNANGVFQFIRVEDIAYDKRTPNVVYFADTGEPRAIADPATSRLRRGPSGTAGPYPNGRIFKLVLDRKDPLTVKSLSILVDGDARGAASAGDLSLIHNPDNVETTKRAILFQEDPGAQNTYAAANANGTTARTWKYDLKTGALTVVAKVNQAALDANAPQGNWESSGIVDASEVIGPGWFFVDIQAHSVLLQQEKRADGITYKREAGQLLLIKIPGT